METQEMIDDLLLHQEGIAARTGAYINPRRKARRNVQRAVTKTWNHRSWPWKAVRTETVTATPGSPHPDLPANFARFDRSSGVFAQPGQTPLAWASPNEMAQLLAGGQTGTPRRWSQGGQSAAGLKTLLLWPLANAAVTLSLAYVPRSPRVSDAFDGEEGTDPDEIALIPEQWHETVIYEWAVYYQMKDKGDIRSRNEQKSIAEDALKTMVTEEMPGATGPNRLPFYGRRR